MQGDATSFNRSTLNCLREETDGTNKRNCEGRRKPELSGCKDETGLTKVCLKIGFERNLVHPQRAHRHQLLASLSKRAYSRYQWQASVR